MRPRMCHQDRFRHEYQEHAEGGEMPTSVTWEPVATTLS
ncbi:MAG: hypothetical protein FD153_462 [Rhodospirillaceae bacterium]|nr:MAG: hypothetical protein FD153_462 [Rhodospirillaceae bacterium]